MSQHAPSNQNHAHGDARPAGSGHTPAASMTEHKPADIRRWRQYLADERAEARVYRELAQNRSGEERAILLALAEEVRPEV